MVKKIILITLLTLCLSSASDTLQKPKFEFIEDFTPERKGLYWIGKIEKADGLLIPIAILYDNLRKKECRGYHIDGYAACIGAITLGEIHINISKKKRKRERY